MSAGGLAKLAGVLRGVLPGVLLRVLATFLGELLGGLLGVLTRIWPLYLVNILLDPDNLIGCGTMSELRLAGSLVRRLVCRSLGVCSA